MKTQLDENQYELLSTVNSLIRELKKSSISQQDGIYRMLDQFQSNCVNVGLIPISYQHDIIYIPDDDDDVPSEVEQDDRLDYLLNQYGEYISDIIDDLEEYKELYSESYRKYEGKMHDERREFYEKEEREYVQYEDDNEFEENEDEF